MVYPVISFSQREPFYISLPPAVDSFLTLIPRPVLLSIPRSIALVSPFVVMWDYKWLQTQRIPQSRVGHLPEYRELQLIVLALRFALWGIVHYTRSPVVVMWTGALMGVTSLLVRFKGGGADVGTLVGVGGVDSYFAARDSIG
jgi:hypothetical protein